MYIHGGVDEDDWERLDQHGCFTSGSQQLAGVIFNSDDDLCNDIDFF